MTSSWKAPLPLVAALAVCGAACRDGAAGLGGAAKCNKKVLVIVDETPGGAAPIAVALTAAGYQVTTSNVVSSDYSGVPVLTGDPPPFGAVVVLTGGPQRSPPADMPAEGQKALVDFVAAGHGLVLTEWAAFHVAAEPPRWQILKPLVLLGRSDAYTGQVTYQVDRAFAAHPIWAGLPASFTFTSTSNVGTIAPAPGVTRIASSPQVGDAVAIRDLPPGRVVHLAHAGNHVPYGFSNIHLQRLVANAVGWAARCP